MRTRLRSVLAALCLAAPLTAQTLLNLDHSCSYGGQEKLTARYTFEPSDEAGGIVAEICNAMSLPQNFTLRSSDVANALATSANGQRIILYNTLFLEQFKAASRTRWAAYSVLAHEVGHHLIGHNFNEENLARRKQMELEADRFSGGVLRLLGAPLDDAKSGIEVFASEAGSGTHPPGGARREAIASGWKRQDERLRDLGVAPTTPVPTAQDADGDGVPDGADHCPTEFGSTTTAGCPDADNDGVADKDDACKYVAGFSRWKGCPDSDNDGLPDHEDQCPSVPGPAALRGCPSADRDADGVPDQSDRCPDAAGLRQFQGCPDTDGDGVPDHDDQCPGEKGLPTANGCPSASSIPATPDTYTDPLVGVMVRVEGGSFQMGSNDGSNDEKPVHSVTLSNYYIGRTEVTQAQWRAVMGSDPSELRFKGCDDCPVERVSWEDVQAFLKKLNARYSGKNYRLPTEAEWEYAARGGAQSKGFKFSGSNDLDEVAWYNSNSDSKTHPVGQKKANELGLHDMSGNVWEWCSDWYGSDYYENSPSSNPTGPDTGSFSVCRGGSWLSGPANCRVALRGHWYPADRDHDLGFRLARTQ